MHDECCRSSLGCVGSTSEADQRHSHDSFSLHQTPNSTLNDYLGCCGCSKFQVSVSWNFLVQTHWYLSNILCRDHSKLSPVTSLRKHYLSPCLFPSMQTLVTTIPIYQSRKWIPIIKPLVLISNLHYFNIYDMAVNYQAATDAGVFMSISWLSTYMKPISRGGDIKNHTVYEFEDNAVSIWHLHCQAYHQNCSGLEDGAMFTPNTIISAASVPAFSSPNQPFSFSSKNLNVGYLYQIRTSEFTAVIDRLDLFDLIFIYLRRLIAIFSNCTNLLFKESQCRSQLG